ncbi:MAG TPA: hypothetical protein VMW15_16455 [Terracidiphilus sp.]|nr:hypothetical protein [Terracidiphilus sp.]
MIARSRRVFVVTLFGVVVLRAAWRVYQLARITLTLQHMRDSDPASHVSRRDSTMV